MLEEYQKKTLPPYQGLYARGSPEDVPQDHGADSRNLDLHTPRKFGIRPGSSLYQNLLVTSYIIVDAVNWVDQNDNAHLVHFDLSGNVWVDNTTLIGNIGSILRVGTVNLFGRLFICPIVQRPNVGHIELWMLYFNATSSTIILRECGSTQPATTMTASVGGAGNVDAGTYFIDVIFLTDTGYYSIPSGANLSITLGAGSLTINLANIPTGPSYVVGRQIIITQSGQLEPYYFVPTEDGGVLNNNTATTTTLNFFATDLIQSADYLFNLRARIEAGNVITVYSGRLVLGSFLADDYGNPYDPTALRLSMSGQPESFDQTLETIIVGKDDGYDITNLAIIRDILYVWKTKGVWWTFDNGSDPVNWSIDTIDQDNGTGLWGISSILPTVSRGTHNNQVVVADIPGIYMFNGAVQEPEITYKVKDLWDASVGDASQINVVVDTVAKRIFVFGFPSGPLYQCSLVGDYNEGITADAIKWDIWTYHYNERVLVPITLPPSVGGNLASPKTQVYTLLTGINSLSAFFGTLIQFDTTQQVDYVNGVTTSPINHYAVLGGQEIDVGINTFNAVLIRAIGSGLLHISIMGEDDVFATNPENRYDAPAKTLVAKPNKEIQCKLNLVAERGFLRLESQPVATNPGDAGSYFSIGRIVLYGNITYAERPA